VSGIFPRGRRSFGDGARFRLALASLALLAIGCGLALPPYNEPFEEKVVVIGLPPRDAQFRIEADVPVDVPIGPDGRTTLPFPVLPRECSSYLFGICVRDRSVEARKLLELRQDGRIVARVSVRQLRQLPVDRAGYHELRLK